MKILHLSYSDIIGGAARSAARADPEPKSLGCAAVLGYARAERSGRAARSDYDCNAAASHTRPEGPGPPDSPVRRR